MGAYLAVFLAATGVTFVATPLVRRVAIRIGAIDQPGDRKVHPKPTPTIGGVAMYLGFVAALGISLFMPYFRDLHAANPEVLASFATCSLMLGLGVIDDLKGIRALTKFTGQVFVGGVLVLFGVRLAYMAIPGIPPSVLIVSADLAVPLTILWVVVISNAVNLVDGLDGLAAGMVAIASIAFFIYMVRSPTSLFGDASEAALLSAITAGICLGFLPWNFHPARIFMGDSGAMLLGMLVSIATISGIARNFYPPSPGDLAAIATPIAVLLMFLFIPFLDVLLAIIRRTRRHQGIAHADKEHIHHRLMDIGHGHRQAVLLMYLWSVLISASALAIGLVDGRLTVFAIVSAATVLFLVTALPRLTERRRNGNGGGAAGLGEGTEESSTLPAPPAADING